MKRPGGRVAILGGGMAGLSAAWRLSEPGWRDRFESITVYQRGWRLGGKGASSRGENGRIEEHGLHIWLGSYENAFALLRECYAELDRATTDPEAPIRTWWQALIPADNPGLADRFGEDWLTWLGTHPTDDELPGDPGRSGREMTVVSFVERALRLVLAFTDSLSGDTATGLHLSTSPDPPERRPGAADRRRSPRACSPHWWPARNPSCPSDFLDRTLIAIRDAIDYETRPSHRRAWVLLSLVTAAVRGIVADNLVTVPAASGRSTTKSSATGCCVTAAIPMCWIPRWCAACTTWCSATRTPIPNDPRWPPG